MTMTESSIITISYTFFLKHRKELCFFGLITVWIPWIFLGFHPHSIPDIANLSLREKIEAITATTNNDETIFIHRIYDIFRLWFQLWTIILWWLTTLFLFKTYKGETPHHYQIIKEYAYKIPKLLLTTLVLSVCLLGLFLLLIIPWFIYSIFWIFTMSVVLYYNAWWREALKKSKTLVEGRRWKTLINNIGYYCIIGWLLLVAMIFLVLGYLWLYNYPSTRPIIDTVFNLIQVPILIYQALLLGHFFLLRTETVPKAETIDAIVTEEVSK